MKDPISNRAGRFPSEKSALFGRDDENSGFLKSSPRQPLSATVAESLILPLHCGIATGTDGIRGEAASPAKGANRLDPHRGAIEILLHVRGHLKETVGRLAETVAEILQNGDGGNGFPADDAAEILGGTVAMAGGGLIGQPRFIAQAGQGIGQRVRIHAKHSLSVEDGRMITLLVPFRKEARFLFLEIL